MFDSPCKKCGKETKWSWDDFCTSCKRKKAIIPAILVGLIILVIGCPIGFISFDYGIDKCNNLKSSVSSYDFDHKIELDANYNSNCYYLKNHPLAQISYVLLVPLMLAIMIGGGIFFGKTI